MNMTDLEKLAVQGSAVGCYCLATHLPNQAFLLYSLTRKAGHVADAEQVAMNLFHPFWGPIKDDNIFVYSSGALVSPYTTARPGSLLIRLTYRLVKPDPWRGV